MQTREFVIWRCSGGTLCLAVHDGTVESCRGEIDHADAKKHVSHPLEACLQ